VESAQCTLAQAGGSLDYPTDLEARRFAWRKKESNGLWRQRQRSVHAARHRWRQRLAQHGLRGPVDVLRSSAGIHGYTIWPTWISPQFNRATVIKPRSRIPRIELSEERQMSRAGFPFPESTPALLHWCHLLRERNFARGGACDYF